MKESREEGLVGNEIIEHKIAMLQSAPSNELLAETIAAIQSRMKEEGQWIVAVEPSIGTQMKLQAMQLENGERWLVAFTSFEEQAKGGNQVMSTFLADMNQLLKIALDEKGVKGVLLNPWNRTLMMDKDLIKIVLGR